jgi:integrase/recombinase XerD
MAISITKRKGSPYWQFRGTVKGQEIYESSGIPHCGRKLPPLEVKKLRAKREEELGKCGRFTFGDAAELYLKVGGSPRFIAPLIGKFGDTYISAFTQTMLDLAAVELYPNCSPQTLNRQFYTPFIAVWTRASKGQNAMCPEVRWARPIGSQRLTQAKRPVSYGDAIKFINECPLHAAKIMFYLFWTGCRPLEAITLECENVDVEKRWAVLTNTKTGEPRGIPLHECLIPMLREEIKKGGRVFRTSKGEPYSENKKLNKTGRIIEQGGSQFASALKGAKTATGLHITPYTARHTVATYLDDKVASKRKDAILGHSRDIRAHYVYLAEPELIEAINKLPMPESLRSDLFPGKIRAISEGDNSSYENKRLVSMG